MQNVIEFLGKPLTDDQIKKVCIKGKSFVDKQIDKQFPKADILFNLKASGREDEYHNLDTDLKTLRRIYNANILSLKDGVFYISVELVNRVNERHTIKTANPKQNEVLAIAKAICNQMNICIKKGYYNFTPETGLTSIPFIKRSENKIIPNATNISNIK